MNAEEKIFIDYLDTLDRDGLKRIAMDEHRSRIELELREEANQRISTEMHIQHSDLLKKYETVSKELADLKVLYQKEVEKNVLKTRNTFGRSTEKFTDLVNAANNKEDDFDDYEEDYYDDDLIEEDENDSYEEKKPSRLSGWFSKGSSSQESDSKDRDKESRESRDLKESREPVSRGGNNSSYSRNTRPSRPYSSSGMSGAGNEVCIFKPTSIEDSREITETLLQGKAVVINFEGLHVEISQRIIDFISGACYALNGNLQKISNFIFIATPDSVDISGDFQDLLASDDNLLDMSGIKPTLI